jgi:pimeloyl-ACP methyl ester carboxylesterase
VHLLGHSWGGWLAMEYALGRPPGLASLVLASTCASLPAFAEETRRLKESLPAEVQKTIDEYDAAGTTDAEAYGEATMAYLTQWTDTAARIFVAAVVRLAQIRLERRV